MGRTSALVLTILVLASCSTVPTEPVAAEATIRWLLDHEHPVRPPVMLVGDTLTFRPELIATDGAVIDTTPDEWQVDYDLAVLSLEGFRARAWAPTPPGRSTELFYKHVATRLAAAIEIVILPDTDP